MSTKLEIKSKTPPKVASSQATTKGKSTAPTSKDPKPQCIACRADKKRCTRVSAKDSELCYWHVDHLKYGIYSETTKAATKKAGKKAGKPAPTENAVVSPAAVEAPNPDGQQLPPKPKTRGRKRKQAIDLRFNDPAYITMWPEICEGTCVLVDRNDNVYSYGTEPITFIGIKLLTGKIDKSSNPRTGF